MPPFTPVSRAVNIRSVQTDGSVHSQRDRASPACLALGTVAGCSSACLDITYPPSCVPFAPRSLQTLHHYYGRSDSCPALPAGQVSPLHAHELPTIPSPTTKCSPGSRTLPFAPRIVPSGRASPLNRRLADTSGRIEFVILRTWSFSSRCFPPRLAGDAVTFGYTLESEYVMRTFTSLFMCAHGRTIPAFAGMTVKAIKSVSYMS